MTTVFLQIAMSSLLAHILGPSDYGLFYFAVSAAILAGQFASLGFPTLMARQIPTYMGRGEWAELKGLLRCAEIAVLMGSLAAVLVAVCFSFFATDPQLRHGLFLSSFLIAPVALRLLRRQQLAAMRLAAVGLFFDETLPPLTLTASALVLYASSATDWLSLYFAACIAGYLVSTFFVLRVTRRGPVTNGVIYRTREWCSSALAMLWVTASRVLLNRIDVLILAPLTTMDQVGYYSAAFRITYLIGFVPYVASATVLPFISGLHSRGEFAALKRFLVGYTLFICLSCSGAALLVSIFAEEIMVGLFGEPFAVAASTLVILAVAQVMAAIAGLISGVMLMVGHQKEMAIINVVALFTNVAIGLVLVPDAGASGAAIAVLVTNVAIVIAAVWSGGRWFVRQ